MFLARRETKLFRRISFENCVGLSYIYNFNKVKDVHGKLFFFCNEIFNLLIEIDLNRNFAKQVASWDNLKPPICHIWMMKVYHLKVDIYYLLHVDDQIIPFESKSYLPNSDDQSGAGDSKSLGLYLTSKDLRIQACRQAFQLTPHCEPFRHVLIQTTHRHNRNQIDLKHIKSLLFLQHPIKPI